MAKRGTCVVCARPDAAEIGAEIRSGGSVRGIAKRIDVNPETLRIHAKRCLGKTTKEKAAEAVIDEIHERRKEILTAPVTKLADQAAIVDELRAMHDLLDEEFRDNTTKMLRLEASQEKRQILKLIGQMIRGQEEERGEASIFETRQWREVEETIIGALRQHERARLDVAAALAALRKQIELGA